MLSREREQGNRNSLENIQTIVTASVAGLAFFGFVLEISVTCKDKLQLLRFFIKNVVM